MTTEWKAISEIPGYEDFTNYSMNEYGDLRNGTGYIMKWTADERNGQLKLKMWGNRKQKTIYQYMALDRLFGVKSDFVKPKQWFFHFNMDNPLI